MPRFGITKTSGNWPYSIVWLDPSKRDLDEVWKVSTFEAIELRDLLLREFPVAAEPAPVPSEPDPDEVRWIVNGKEGSSTWGATFIAGQERTLIAVAKAWLRSREQQPDRFVLLDVARETDAHREHRERIATAVLAGYRAGGGEWAEAPADAAASWALADADALIKELDRDS